MPNVATENTVILRISKSVAADARALAQEENRSEADLIGEALRVYVAIRREQKAGARQTAVNLIRQAQRRTSDSPKTEIRELIREALKATESPAKNADSSRS